MFHLAASTDYDAAMSPSTPHPIAILLAASTIVAVVIGPLGCASNPCSKSQVPSERAATERSDDADAPGSPALAASTPVDPSPSLPGLMSLEPSADAPAQVREDFGRLVGAWSCQSEARQPDGTFKAAPGLARWTFFYTLGGLAVGDLFEPAATTGAAKGINLRVYDPEAERWVLAWTTPQLARFDHYTARREGEALVMRGDVAAKGQFPDHSARITFDELRDDSFEWRYEATTPGADGPWQTFSRIHCRAVEAGPTGDAGAPPQAVAP